MRLLQVSRKLRNHACNIHPRKWVSMVERYGPDIEQKWVHRDSDFSVLQVPDVVVVHAVNQTPWVVQKVRDHFPAAKVVSLPYNSLWLSDDSYKEVSVALQHSDLVIGRLPPRTHLSKVNFMPLKPLVDAYIFSPPIDNSSRYMIFLPRGHNGRDPYWPEETAQALDGMGCIYRAAGDLSEWQMAEMYRKSRVVISLREDAGPAYSTVEAILCGAIPVVSKHVPILKELPVGVGFRAATRSRRSIRLAVNSIMKLTEEEYAEEIRIGQEHLLMNGYTLQDQAPVIIESLRKLAKQ
jgi:hypothetical protein